MDWAEILKLVAAGLAGGGMALLKDIVLGRTALRTKRVETEPALLEATMAELKETRGALREVKHDHEQCREEIHHLKGNLQTTWLAMEMILQKCPQADRDVQTAIRTMRGRQDEFFGEKDGAAPEAK